MSRLFAEKDWDALFATIKRYLEAGDMKDFGKRLRLRGVKENGGQIPVDARLVETQVGEKLLLFTIALHEPGGSDEET